jgi:hypothetical protein
LLEAFDIAAHFRIYDVSTLADNETLFLHWLEYFRLKPHLTERLDIMLPSYFAAVLNRLNNLGVVMLERTDGEPVTADQLKFDWMAEPEPVPDAEGYVEQTRTAETNMAAAICAAFGG